MAYFDSVTTNRTQLTDTDHDGMTDYAEFIAGTDPTNAASKLAFISILQTNRQASLQWGITFTDRLYQLETSTNLTTWSAATGWLPAAGSSMSCTITNAAETCRFFRVQVRTDVVTQGSISLSKNLGQGTWSLFPLSTPGLVQSGVTPAVTFSNLDAGQYVVQFGNVPYYQTPASQTNTLAAGSTLSFTGNYTFLDANQNGISDAWETACFGSVATNRTQLTDTDHDGMTDYAEFIAGTDPTNAASRFYFTGETILSNRLVQIQWTVATNRLYQLNVSTNLSGWLPVSGWLQASNGPTMNCTVTNTGDGSHFYRVQVQP